MANRKITYIIILAFLILAVIFAGIIYYCENDKSLKVVFLDVGQGDAILVIQGQNQMLVDGGRDGKLILEKLGKYIPFWDRNIEVVVATHPDQDHIGGLVSVLKAYNVKSVIETETRSKSQTYEVWEKKIGEEKSNEILAEKGVNVKFSQSLNAEIIYPFSDSSDGEPENSNEDSVVIKIIANGTSFLLTGELPSGKEMEIVQNGENIDVDILKVAHHGSKYSTSKEFLEKTTPKEAVISVGKNNSYGHPNQEVLERLNSFGVKIIRTDETGDIVYNF